MVLPGIAAAGRRGTARLAAAALAAALALFAPAAQAAQVDGIAAVVNGDVITILELEKAGRTAVDERLRGAAESDRERLRRETLAVVLQQLVMLRIQAQRAAQLGIQVAPAEVDTAIANIREDNRMSEDVLARVLEERGMTMPEYRRDIEDQIRLSKLVQREIRAKITATDAEVAAYFQEHHRDWHRPARIRIRHLLVPLPATATAAEVETARARADELMRQARGGADFAALIRGENPRIGADSDPVSGEIAAGELFPELEKVAFALAVGEVGGPVQGPAGFHLVQAVEKTPAYEPQLEEVRASIEQRIVDKKTRERFDGWIKQIRAEAIVEVRF